MKIENKYSHALITEKLILECELYNELFASMKIVVSIFRMTYRENQ